MTNKPILSIVTATLGKFTDHWLEQLLSIKGEAEFLMIYPPGVAGREIADPRVKIIHSMFKGETPQRICGFLNANGSYAIALDDDDILHPDIVGLVQEYFSKFPDSWVLRPYTKIIPMENEAEFCSPWPPLPELESLKVVPRRNTEDQLTTLQEVPIIPFGKSINWWVVLWPYAKRKDKNGAHMENFNNRIWKTTLVKETLLEITEMMRFANPFTWIPSWGIDRLTSVYLQAKFYQPGLIIGHWLPQPEQVRYLAKPQYLRTNRYIIQSEILIFKRFSQYGYVWNFFFEEFYCSLKTKIRSLLHLEKDKKQPLANSLNNTTISPSTDS